MDFLTPEIFNILIVFNLLLGAVLIVFRFYRDMTRPPQDIDAVRELSHDERSFYAASDDLSEADAAALLNDNQAKRNQNR